MKRNFVIVLTAITMVIVVSLLLYTKYIKLTIHEIEKRVVHELDTITQNTHTPQIILDKNCVFDVANQTDDFLKGKPELSRYVWNKETKTATVKVDQYNTLTIERGGCQYFNYYITLTQQHSTLDSSQPEKIIKKAIETAFLVFDNSFLTPLQHALLTGDYEKIVYDHMLKYNFTFEDKCIAEIVFLKEPSTQEISLKVGYTLCKYIH